MEQTWKSFYGLYCQSNVIFTRSPVDFVKTNSTNKTVAQRQNDKYGESTRWTGGATHCEVAGNKSDAGPYGVTPRDLTWTTREQTSLLDGNPKNEKNKQKTSQKRNKKTVLIVRRRNHTETQRRQQSGSKPRWFESAPIESFILRFPQQKKYIQ